MNCLTLLSISPLSIALSDMRESVAIEESDTIAPQMNRRRIQQPKESGGKQV